MVVLLREMNRQKDSTAKAVGLDLPRSGAFGEPKLV